MLYIDADVCLCVNDARDAAAAAAGEVAWEWRVWEMCESVLLESQADVGGKDDWRQTGELLASFLLVLVIIYKWSFKQTVTDLHCSR